MKKLLTLLFCFGIFFSLTACGNKEENEWIEASKLAKNKVLEMFNCSESLFMTKRFKLEDKLTFSKEQEERLKTDIDEGNIRLVNDSSIEDLKNVDTVYYFYYPDTSGLSDHRGIEVYCSNGKIIAHDYNSYTQSSPGNINRKDLYVFYDGQIEFSMEDGEDPSSELLSKMK